MTSLQKRLKRKDRVGTAKDQTNVIQKKNTRVKAEFKKENNSAIKAIRDKKAKAANKAKADKEDNLVVAFPNKDMFKNVF
jgi:membrane protein involved in colicin uptake